VSAILKLFVLVPPETVKNSVSIPPVRGRGDFQNIFNLISVVSFLTRKKLAYHTMLFYEFNF
jgi:hypothetical protein